MLLHRLNRISSELGNRRDGLGTVSFAINCLGRWDMFVANNPPAQKATGNGATHDVFYSDPVYEVDYCTMVSSNAIYTTAHNDKRLRYFPF